MATPSVRLAASLAQLNALQQEGRRVFRANEFTRVHRDRLIRNGLLRTVMKGWLMSTSPDAASGDTTPWFASFWEFCAAYCTSRFGENWHLSAEQSLLIHGENTTVPAKLVVSTPCGTNNRIDLPFDTSIYDLKEKEMPSDADLTVKMGLRLLSPEVALIRVSRAFFVRHSVTAQVVLSTITDHRVALERLLNRGQPVIAGRIAGALRHMGQQEKADDILRAMKSAGYDVRESDPFSHLRQHTDFRPESPPIVARLKSLWESSRTAVVEAFPKALGLPTDAKAFLLAVDEKYQQDAYHSLSIEGYRVTPELIARVRDRSWNPDRIEADRPARDVLAARGYWQAFQSVRKSVGYVVAGANPGTVVRTAHRDWYRELFQPSVTAGLIGASALAGYRNQSVFIRGSRHVPPRPETVGHAMSELFDLLEAEVEPSVRAVLGHWLFGYIHPYSDGNGRLARFVMNVMLASGGFPWTVIPVEDRDPYLEALETASVGGEISPFANFIARQVQESGIRT